MGSQSPLGPASVRFEPSKRSGPVSPNYANIGRSSAVATDQTEILNFLNDPSSYGLSEPVDRLDMSRTILFMAGSFCYKLRRSCPLGQDMALSLADRRHLASEEMRLGALYAPDLYLGLVAVQQNGDHLKLSQHDDAKSCEGKVVDWLVQMRRYDFSKSYDKLVGSYEPSFHDCCCLSDVICRLHNCATPRAAGPWLGFLTDQLDKLEGEFAKLGTDAASMADSRCMKAALARAKERLRQLRPLIRYRGERGFIRQIHGDLRLSNVVQLPGGPILVNPQVEEAEEGVGDPFYDLSSLLAELWSRGLSQSANWIFSRYCNRLPDSDSLDGLQALDLYLFMRAFERAGILQRAFCHHSHLGQRRQNRYLNSIQSFTRSAREALLQDEPVVIVIAGRNPISRGRLARTLAPVVGRMPGALYLSSEQELRTLQEIEKDHYLTRSIHSSHIQKLLYYRLHEKARHAIKAGYSVVIEGNYESDIARWGLPELAAKSGVRMLAIRLKDHNKSHHMRECQRSDLCWFELDANSPQDLLARQVLAQINLSGSPYPYQMLH